MNVKGSEPPRRGLIFVFKSADQTTRSLPPEDGRRAAVPDLFLKGRSAKPRSVWKQSVNPLDRLLQSEAFACNRGNARFVCTLPKSALGKAIAYTLNQWPKLRRCFDYAEVELSNNLAENSMHPVALGRKNWLHVGSEKAGPKVAAILSIVESCRRMGVPLKDYLLEVLPGLDYRKLSEVARLTPANWSAARI